MSEANHAARATWSVAAFSFMTINEYICLIFGFFCGALIVGVIWIVTSLL
jgi:hypothetical protein